MVLIRMAMEQEKVQGVSCPCPTKAISYPDGFRQDGLGTRSNAASPNDARCSVQRGPYSAASLSAVCARSIKPIQEIAKAGNPYILDGCNAWRAHLDGRRLFSSGQRSLAQAKGGTGTPACDVFASQPMGVQPMTPPGMTVPPPHVF
jgi:hypothetical protein